MSFDDLFDDLEPDDSPVATEPEPDKPEPATNGHKSPPSKHAYLYLDLETVPDYSRQAQFDLPALPPYKTEDLLSAKEFCSQSLKEIEQSLSEFIPPAWWLENVEAEEAASAKPRKGLFEAVAKIRSLIDDRRKLLSVTPEYCRIVAAGWSVSGDEISARVIGKDREDEIRFLEEFWEWAKSVRTIVGFNCLHFDLPVILIRSALLGVTPSRRINLSPYRNTDVCDLMTLRWPKSKPMGLKPLAKALGIEIPADDVDGSMVEDLYNREPERLKEYVKSDVEITRKVHQVLSGYFWD